MERLQRQALWRASTIVMGASALLTSCSDSSGPTDETGPVRVEISAGATLEMLGDTVRLTAVARDAEGRALPGTPITWESSNTAVATVDGAGLVRALASGSAGIRARAGAVLSTSAEVEVDAGSWLQLAAAEDATCGIAPSGSAFCWGDNARGQLGVGDPEFFSSRVPTALGGTLRLSAISAGEDFFCGLSEAGEAWCWGYNRYGQLGAGSPETVLFAPARVQHEGAFRQISAGVIHTCALEAQGRAWCWGDNRGGQLGDGSTTSSATPVRVLTEMNFETISAGLFHTCGRTSVGAVFCWGAGTGGELGTGEPVSSVTPVQVEFEGGFAAIAAGPGHTCGVASSGAAYCWGAGEQGQLGTMTGPCSADHPIPCSAVPIRVPVEAPFREVYPGGLLGTGYSCGVSLANQAWCWGTARSGQLGRDGLGDTAPPGPVAGPPFRGFAAGASHACGIAADNRLAYCWGHGGSGRLGTGTEESRATPVAVAQRRTPGT